MPVRNRVWDTVEAGFVVWETGSSDPAGIEYPGPGDFSTNTSDFTVVRDTQQQPPAAPEVLSPEDSPAGSWSFDGSLNDESGNGRNFGVTAGIEQYGPGPAPGTRALYCNGGSRFSVSDAAFAALGDVTIEALVYPHEVASGQAFIATYAGALETEATNAHYSLRLVADNFAAIFHESGAGVNEDLDSTFSVPPYTWSHFACVRDGSDDKLYINGELVLTTAALNAPTGGGSNALVVGDFPAATGPYLGFVSSLRVYPGVVRSDAQLLRAAEKALPLGVRP